MEQKSFSVVRQFLGYRRLDNPELNVPLNDFFVRCWRECVNFFFPTQTLVRKESVGSKTRRIYEPMAQPPYNE